jgi:hypothetical protein
MSTENTKNNTTATGALSAPADSFDFLSVNKAETFPDIASPLDVARKEATNFAKYNTGTIKMTVSPQLLTQLEAIKSMKVTKEFRKLAQFVEILQSELPNSDGKPTVLIDPSVFAEFIPNCDSPADITDSMKERSQLPLEIYDDVATINGIPVWERLSGERMDFYNIFKIYRDMRYGMLDNGDYVILSRTIAGLGRELGVPGILLSVLAKTYNWSARCAYYDTYMDHEIQKKRMQQVQLLQSDHFKLANRLMNKALDYLEKHSAAMKPRDAIEMLKLGFEYSRISVGLPGDKPNGGAAAPNQPTLAIYNTTTNNQADQMLNINAAAGNSTNQNCGSAVERQLQRDMKDENNLLSILHCLQQSGAMATAISENLIGSNSSDEGDSAPEMIDVAAVLNNSPSAANKDGGSNE